ncbi:protoporphyrinogen/coproporphyrinogen oxidase [Aliiroseovarius crassostreae]|uniref:protoporphyrinogen/coproporphyrinogen oxidase n=1 Tax=Aliiroseovarius crassostreae TaxID=154981 RepID=UPI00220B0C16|nr:NAD(P)/FAD-dependent oxidoreductase [Aliiroseovarius crassostreae]UWP90879.1 FAD-dependent oxidoreductase [Aliiroseovarius crassostreae]UWQ03543.1 FAD-dependent oxidoreductase [Aliiroseovarius crassostreae]
MKPVHIIGAGISGLGAAHFLARKGIPSILHEAGDYVGGRAACLQQGAYAFEIGGKNFSSAWPRFNTLLREFGMNEFEDQHPGFHIVLRDQLIALEKSKTLAGDLRLATALGPRGALQFRNFLSFARKNADRLNYSSGLIEEVERRWDHATIDRHFSKALNDGPLRLFSIIMGAAEPSELYPSLMMLFASGFGKGSHHAIKGGIGQFHDKLAAGKDIRLGSHVTGIKLENGAVCGLEMAGGDVLSTDRVISAVPAHVLRRLVDLPAYGRVAFDALRYYPLAMVNVVYDAPVFRNGVHSIMFEPGAPLGHCSANRLDTPNHVRFTLSGRAARDILDRSDDELVTIAEETFSKRLPITAQRVQVHVARHPGGICGYAPYFSRVKRDILRAVDNVQGLEIAGDYLEGHTMEGCLTSADLAVERLLQQQPLSRVAA